MGGYGSGVTGWKPKSEQSCKIDIRYMNKNGMLQAGVTSTWAWSYANKSLGDVSITSLGSKLTIQQNNKPQSSAQHISLTWTACNYGGQRPWFLCPVCKRRAAILFWASEFFSCSHCNDITYYSRCESPLNRLLRKKRKIQKRISSDDGWGLGFFYRPKGMHKKTFERLIDEYSEIERQIDDQAEIQLGESF